MKQASWKCSNEPQKKPKQSYKKLKQWNKAFNLMRAKLKKGETPYFYAFLFNLQNVMYVIIWNIDP